LHTDGCWERDIETEKDADGNWQEKEIGPVYWRKPLHPVVHSPVHSPVHSKTANSALPSALQTGETVHTSVHKTVHSKDAGKPRDIEE